MIIPHRNVAILERLGKYHRTIHAGFTLIIPFVDRIAYKHSLKEIAIDVPKQVCITKDNIAVEVDGVLYLQVMDPQKASYGIHDYLFATTQIAQTTMRSVIGKLDLDQTFEERDNINSQIVEAADKASDPWGIKVNRYEIKDIKPPATIQGAMEKQMRAEREKRAKIAESEGEMQAKINVAKGKSAEIKEVAQATATGLKSVADVMMQPGAKEALSLKIGEQYVQEFGKLAKETNTVILPANLSDIGSMVTIASSLFERAKAKAKDPKNISI